MHLFALLSQATSSASSSQDLDLGGVLTVLNLGLAGVGILAYHKRWIVPGGTYMELQEREKRTSEELSNLRSKVEEQILPELIKAREIQIRVAATMDKFISFVERTQGARDRGDE